MAQKAGQPADVPDSDLTLEAGGESLSDEERAAAAEAALLADGASDDEGEGAPEGDGEGAGDDGGADEGYSTPEEIAAYLESQGYTVGKPGAAQAPAVAPAVADTRTSIAPAEAPADGFSAQFEALKKRYSALYAQTFDDVERFEIQAEFQREVNQLQLSQIERQSARAEGMAQLPIVEAKFEEHGLPKAAAVEYVNLIASMDPATRANPAAQRDALALAIGRASLQQTAAAPKPGTPNPKGIRIPKGEGGAPSGKAPVKGVDPHELAVLRRTFPKVEFTAAKIAELRKEGVI